MKFEGLKAEIRTSKAPAPAGAYSQGIVACTGAALRPGALLFTAGQIGKNPETGEIPSDIEGQTWQALENIRAILAEASIEVCGIVKTTVHLQSFDDFDRFNETYAKFFAEYAPKWALPVRTTVESGLGGALVEIDAIAVRTEV